MDNRQRFGYNYKHPRVNPRKTMKIYEKNNERLYYGKLGQSEVPSRVRIQQRIGRNPENIEIRRPNKNAEMGPTIWQTKTGEGTNQHCGFGYNQPDRRYKMIRSQMRRQNKATLHQPKSERCGHQRFQTEGTLSFKACLIQCVLSFSRIFFLGGMRSI